MRFADILMTAATRANVWTPQVLGSSLLAWWDADRTDLITQSGGAVSSWKDVVGGYDAVQATGAAQPLLDATGFNGKSAVVFDGSNDELTASVPGTFPVGASPSEIWALVDQKSANGVGAAGYILTYGNSGNTNSRAIYKTVSGGATRARALQEATASTADINPYVGRHVHRGIFSATTVTVEIDGALAAPAAQVPNTASTRLRIGANAADPAAGFGPFAIRRLLVTLPLSTGQADALRAYLSRDL